MFRFFLSTRVFAWKGERRGGCFTPGQGQEGIRGIPAVSLSPGEALTWIPPALFSLSVSKVSLCSPALLHVCQ